MGTVPEDKLEAFRDVILLPTPEKEDAVTVPFTSNVLPGFVFPIPTYPLLPSIATFTFVDEGVPKPIPNLFEPNDHELLEATKNTSAPLVPVFVNLNTAS